MKSWTFLVDVDACQQSHQPEYELQTFYGQMQHIYMVQFPATCEALSLNGATTIILATIRCCVLDSFDLQLESLDIQALEHCMLWI